MLSQSDIYELLTDRLSRPPGNTFNAMANHAIKGLSPKYRCDVKGGRRYRASFVREKTGEKYEAWGDSASEAVCRAACFVLGTPLS